MSTNARDIDEGIKALLEKLSEEFEIVKRQGFPARKRDVYSRYARQCDVKIPEPRWRAWANELGMDAARFEGILNILVKEGFLEQFKSSPDYI
jgi:hypothetical protein